MTEAQFTLAVAAHCVPIRQAIYQVTGNFHDTEDVYQSVQIKAWQDHAEFASIEHYVAWCCKVGKNAARDLRRAGNPKEKYVVNRQREQASTNVKAEHDRTMECVEALWAGVACLKPKDQALLGLVPIAPVHSKAEASRMIAPAAASCAIRFGSSSNLPLSANKRGTCHATFTRRRHC